MKNFKEIIQEAKYGTHLIKNPAGTYSFVGDVPVQLAYKKKDGSKLTNDEITKIQKSSNPGMQRKVLGIELQIYKTPEEALKAAKKIGVKVKPFKEAKDSGKYESIKYFGKKNPGEADELRQHFYGIADHMESFVAGMNSLNGETGDFGDDLKLAKQLKKIFDKISLGKYV